jgi:nucleoside-diphosphate-sugar epimerase
MTALVTGASGFIGSHLVDALVADGGPVRALVRGSSRRDHLPSRGVELAIGDVGDVDALAAALEGVDVVYHVAGLTSAFSRAEFERVNTIGTANLYEAARRARRGPRRVVQVSSLMAAGPSHPQVARREHHRIEEFTQYGASKLAAEKIAFEVACSGAMEIVIVRPPLVYGPRDTEVLQILRAAKLHLVGQAGLHPKWLSAVHVSDLVAGILAAARVGRPLPAGGSDHVLRGGGEPTDHVPVDPSHPAGRGIYYFTDGDRHTEGSFGQAAARALGKRAVTIPLARPVVLGAGLVSQAIGRLRGKPPTLSLDKARGTLGSGWWCDHGRAAAELDYRPQWPLELGLEATVAWLRERRIL